MIARSCDFIAENHSRLVDTLPRFEAIGLVEVEIYCIQICHKTSQDKILGSCTFMEASFSLHGTILPSLVAIGIEVRAIFLICQMTLRDHMFEGSCDFMGGIFSLYVTTMPSLLARYIVVVDIFLISHVIKKSKRRKKMTK